MRYCFKEWVRNIIIRFFMSTQTNFDDECEQFDASDYEARYIVNSSIIVCYKKENDIKYFRECRKHEGLKQYIHSAIEDYFENICTNVEKAQLKRLVFEDLKNKINYRRLINIGSIFNAHLIDILSKEYRGYRETGLPSFEQFECQEEFISFIQYIHCIIMAQKLNSHLKKGQNENNSANKQLATYELAKYLGVTNLVPEVKLCKLIGDTVVKTGTLMENAPGMPPSDILPKERKNIDRATFFKDITTLEYFDALCYQLDHRLDNYHIIKNDDGQIARIVAFDNDAGRTFFVNARLPKQTYAGAGCVISRTGVVNRPYIDKEFVEHLFIAKRSTLFNAVGKYMSRIQFIALWKRLKKLSKAVKKTSLLQTDFIVRDWGMVDADKMKDEKFGCTYYSLYLNDTVMLERKGILKEFK